MPNISKAALSTMLTDQWKEGVNAGVREGKQQAREELAAQKQVIQLEQLKAATELLHEAGKLLSRAGYMVGKITGNGGY